MECLPGGIVIVAIEKVVVAARHGGEGRGVNTGRA
jgi:hypothetical protein